MSLLEHKLKQLEYYAFLVNPFIARKYRVCRSFARDAHKHLDLLEQSQWWQIDKLKAYQDDKLRDLLRHAYKTVPYYTELLVQNGIKPDDIRTSDDLVRLPILTKQLIRSNFPERIRSVSQGLSEGAAWTTGGSTGEPLRFFGDTRSSSVAWASFFRFCGWMGYEWGDSIAVFWRAQAHTSPNQNWYQRVLDWLQKTKIPNVRHFNASTMGEEHLRQYATELAHMRPQVLRGYVSALTCLAEYNMRHPELSIRPKVITTTAEVLSPHDRELLKRSFGADVFDQYGSAECMGVAFECPEHAGLHTTMEHCIVEFVDEHGNRVADGQKGMLVVTDLDNYNMPFIRYMNGDVGSYRGHGCSCGRGLRLIDYVDGRSIDMIRGINGNSAHGLLFVTVLQELGWLEKYGVKDFEIVQKAADWLECSFVCHTNPDRTSEAAFVKVCHRHFGEMRINVRFVDSIAPGASGKRRRTRSEVTTR